MPSMRRLFVSYMRSLMYPLSSRRLSGLTLEAFKVYLHKKLEEMARHILWHYRVALKSCRRFPSFKLFMRRPSRPSMNRHSGALCKDALNKKTFVLSVRRPSGFLESLLWEKFRIFNERTFGYSMRISSDLFFEKTFGSSVRKPSDLHWRDPWVVCKGVFGFP